MAAKPPQVSVSPLRRRGGGRSPSGSFPIAPATPSARSPCYLVLTQRWQVAAALSAAVTTTKPIGEAPTSQAEPTMQKQPTQTPAALREGARGRGFSQRSRLPRIPRTFPIPSYSSGEGVWGRGASLREAASPPESPYRCLFEREREGGGFSSEKPPPSHPHFRLIVISAFWWGALRPSASVPAV